MMKEEHLVVCFQHAHVCLGYNNQSMHSKIHKCVMKMMMMMMMRGAVFIIDRLPMNQFETQTIFHNLRFLFLLFFFFILCFERCFRCCLMLLSYVVVLCCCCLMLLLSLRGCDWCPPLPPLVLLLLLLLLPLSRCPSPLSSPPPP